MVQQMTVRYVVWIVGVLAVVFELPSLVLKIVNVNGDFAMSARMAALHWMARGYGYQITTSDVLEAYSSVLNAACCPNVCWTSVDKPLIPLRHENWLSPLSDERCTFTVSAQPHHLKISRNCFPPPDFKNKSKKAWQLFYDKNVFFSSCRKIHSDSPLMRHCCD